MKLNKLYLHIGLHKTATTSLQIDTFPFIDGVGFIGRHQVDRRPQGELYLALSRYCFCREKPGNIELASIRNKIHEQLSKKSLLLSEEWFSSDYDSFFQGKGARWQEKLRRLADVVDGLNCSVLVTVRNPCHAIYSLFTEFLRVGYAKQYSSFLAFTEKSNDVTPYFYNQFYSFVCRTFPSANIMFLRYEHLSKDPLVFLKNMEIFFDGRSIPPPGMRNITQKNKKGSLVLRQKPGFLRDAFHLIPYGARGLIWSMLPAALVTRIKGAFVIPEIVAGPTEKEMMKVSERFSESETFLRTLDNGSMRKPDRSGTSGKT